MKSKYILLIFMSLIILPTLIGLVSAEDNKIVELDSVQQSECKLVPQGCASCSYVNVSIFYGNITLVDNQNMEQSGATWTYQFCNTSNLGRYDVVGHGDLEGTDTAFSGMFFKVTPSGNSGYENLIFNLFIIVAIYAINLFGFFGKNATMTLLGGMFLIFLGVYLINNGIIIYRDDLTNYFSYITIAWGAVSTLMAAYSMYEDM